MKSKTNYPDNKIKWNVGDIVIHRSDAKTDKMLMMVIRTNYEPMDTNNGMVATIYLRMCRSR